MSTRRNVETRRRAAFLLLPLLWLVGACEQRQAAPEAELASFVPPEVDVKRLPEGLWNRVAAMRAAVEQAPKDPQAVAGLGAVYFVHGFPDEAALCFERARKLAPQSAQWSYWLGLAYDRAEAPEKAIAAYEAALELDSNYGPLYVRLADLLVKSDRQRAEKLCQRALELNPRDATALFRLGLCAEAAGDKPAAIERYEEALKIAPAYKDVHEALASVLASLGRDEEAQQHREAAASGVAVAVDDSLLQVLLRNGWHLQTLLGDVAELAKRGLFTEADAALARVAEADPTGTATHVATGRVRTMQNRFEEAADEFRLALERAPERLDIQAWLADVQARLAAREEDGDERANKFAAAEAGFRAVLGKDPDNAFALEHYSQLLLTLQRGAEAETLLREAAQRQPESAWPRFQLGIVLSSLGKNDAAREELEAGLKISPNDAQALYYLGVLAQDAGDMERAKQYWEQAVEARPEFVDAYVALAAVALQEGDRASAERYLRAGLAQAPTHVAMANGLAWILGTSPDDDQRKGDEAVALAERACALTQRARHQYLDTLAAAYAEAGRFDDAVKAAREALEGLGESGDEQVRADYQARLHLYEEGKPYRDTD